MSDTRPSILRLEAWTVLLCQLHDRLEDHRRAILAESDQHLRNAEFKAEQEIVRDCKREVWRAALKCQPDLLVKELQALLAERKVYRDALKGIGRYEKIGRAQAAQILTQAAQLVLDDEGDQDE